MSDYELKRINALTEASSYGDADYLAVDGANGTKKLSKAKLIEGAVTPAISNLSGVFDNVIAGNAKQLLGSMSVIDKEPYQFRTTGGSSDVGDREFLSITGGSLPWNQLANVSGDSDWAANNATKSYSDGVETMTATAQNGGIYFYAPVVAGHKYLLMMTVKLTTAVADKIDINIYGGATKYCKATTDWQTVATISNSISASHSSYHLAIRDSRSSDWDAIQVKNPQLFDLTQLFGPTIADYIYSLEQSHAGDGVAWFRKYFPKDYYAYHAPNLEHVTGLSLHRTIGFNAYDRSTGKAKVVGGMEYEVVGSYTGLSLDGTTITPVSNKFTPSHSGELTVTGGDSSTCIHLRWSGYRDGEYEPYVKHEYPLDSTITLRGVPVLRDGKLEFDGDVYESDGTVTRKFATYTVTGNETWEAWGNAYFCNVLNPYALNDGNTINCIADKLVGTRSSLIYSDAKGVAVRLGNLYIDADSYSNRASLVGMNVLYKLATPTTETAEPFTSPQECDDFGTEEFVTTSLIPIGHETSYPANLRDKIQHLPDSTGTAGTYLITEDSQEHQSLTQFPMPSADGTYTLKCTKSGTTVTMAWVADE